MERTETYYSVWIRGDGYIGSSSGGCPRNYGTNPINQFEELLLTNDWPSARIRIKAERTAAVMNEDLFPISESAASNRIGVNLSGRL